MDQMERSWITCVVLRLQLKYPFRQHLFTPIHTLALVVPNTRYNSQVPLIIGINVIREAKVDQCTDSNVPTE